MIVVYFIALFIGVAIIGCLWSEVIKPKIEKAMEPDPEWDQKTVERFNRRNTWIIILVLLLAVGVLRKCGLMDDNPESDPWEEPVFK